MKQILKLALVATLLFTTQPSYGESIIKIMTFNLGALIKEVKQFVEKEIVTYGKDIRPETIENALRKAINVMPNTLFGIDTQEGILDGEAAEQTDKNLKYVIPVIKKIHAINSAFDSEPEIAFHMIEMAYSLIKNEDKIPNVVRILGNVLTLIQTIVDANASKNVTKAFDQIIQQISIIIEDLKNYKEKNGSLKEYNFGRHIPKFKTIINENWNPTKTLIQNNGPAITNILKEANDISLKEIEDTIELSEKAIKKLMKDI